jgi:hypothetical protein
MGTILRGASHSDMRISTGRYVDKSCIHDRKFNVSCEIWIGLYSGTMFN